MSNFTYHVHYLDHFAQKAAHGNQMPIATDTIVPNPEQPTKQLSYEYRQARADRLGLLAIKDSLDDVEPNYDAARIHSLYYGMRHLEGSMGLLLQSVGIHTFHQDTQSPEGQPVTNLWLTVPSAQQLNTRISKLNHYHLPPEHRLPSFGQYAGGEYTGRDFTRELADKNQILLSGSNTREHALEYVLHDVVEHVPYWLMSTVRFRNFLRARSKRFVNNPAINPNQFMADVDNAVSGFGIGNALKPHTIEREDTGNYISKIIGKQHANAELDSTYQHLQTVLNLIPSPRRYEKKPQA